MSNILFVEKTLILGGGIIYMFTLAEELVNIGHTIFILAEDGFDKFSKFSGKIKFLPFKLDNIKDTDIMNILEQVNPDLIVINSDYACVFATYLLKYYKGRSVCILHQSLHLDLAALLKGKTNFVAVNNRVFDKANFLGFKPISILRNPISFDRYYPDTSNEVCKFYGLTTCRLIDIYILVLADFLNAILRSNIDSIYIKFTELTEVFLNSMFNNFIHAFSMRGKFLEYKVGEFVTSNDIYLSNYCFGSRRFIIESLACEKPCVVLSNKNVGIIVTEENFDDLAKNNFSIFHTYLDSKILLQYYSYDDILRNIDSVKHYFKNRERLRQYFDVKVIAKQFCEILLN